MKTSCKGHIPAMHTNTRFSVNSKHLRKYSAPLTLSFVQFLLFYYLTQHWQKSKKYKNIFHDSSNCHFLSIFGNIPFPITTQQKLAWVAVFGITFTEKKHRRFIIIRDEPYAWVSYSFSSNVFHENQCRVLFFLRLIMKPHNERQYLRDQLAAFHISASKLIDMIHH